MHYYRIRRSGSTERKIPKDMIIGAEFKNKSGLAFVITEYKKSTKVMVRFLGTGFECNCTSYQVRSGSVKDKLSPSVFGVGFIGDGDYKTANGSENTPQYKRWLQMMRRCYSDKFHEYNKSYINCSVCVEWHNFQNFAKWYERNKLENMTGIHLDKDKLSSDKKIYSPETCMFLTAEENSKAGKECEGKEYSIIKDGVIRRFSNISKEAEIINGDSGNLCRLVNGKVKSHKGWRLCDE